MKPATFTEKRTRTLGGSLDGVTIETDDQGVPIRIYDGSGTWSYDPEQIEALGVMLADMRKAAKDERKVCQCHGYFTGYGACPTCEDEELAVDGKERCEACSKAKGWRQYHLPGEHTVKAEQVA